MLILGRRPGESILMDGGIRVVVISCDKRGVRLGIEAPSTVSILRGEIASQPTDDDRGHLAGTVAPAGRDAPAVADGTGPGDER